MALTSKQAKFVKSYQETGDLKQAVIQAGYSPKTSNSVAVEANRLLKNPKVSLELANWRSKKSSEITKDDFVDMALTDYKALEVTEPNKPRMLDIAGKALGYLNNNGDSRPNQTLNITVTSDQLNNAQGNIWENTRKLLGN